MGVFTQKNKRSYLLFLCLPLWLFSQAPAHFQHFNEKQGLSQNTVTALYQDPAGFLWVGTEEGLNRFDGKEFRVFRFLRSDTNSLSNSNIRCIFSGKNNKFWVGTQYGLNRYDPETEQFERFIVPDTALAEAKNYVLGGTLDRRGYVWFGTYDGMFRLDPENREWLHFPADTLAENGVNSNSVWEVFEDRDGLLWIGTSNGLNLLDNDDNFVVEKYFHEPGNPRSLPSTRVFDVAQSPDGTVWMATRNGLARASGPPGDLQFFHYQNDPADANSISTDFLWKIMAGADGQLWLPTYGGGLNKVFFPEGKEKPPKVARYQHDEKRPASIAHNEANAVLRDRSGILWVGTAAGLDKIDPAAGRFQLLQNVPDDPFSLRSDHLLALHFSSRGDLWLGTRGGGLHRLSAEKMAAGKYEFEIFQNDPADPTSLSHNDVFGISEDSHGYLWVATYDGLNVTAPSAARAEHAAPKFHRFAVADGLAYKFQFQVLQRKNGEHWVATYGRLNRLDFDPENPDNSTFAEFDMSQTRSDALVNATTHSLVEDRFGQLWVGTFNGISKLVSAEGAGVFENYLHRPGDSTSLSNNYVSQLFSDSRGRLWAATRSGLNFIEQTAADAPATFRSFGLADGLPSEAVRAISEDAEGRLWLSTTSGLAFFDPEIALGKTGEMPVLKRFDYRDGLQGNEFSERAALRGPDGRLYFGGINGLNVFNPQNLWENPYVPPVVFTELRLFNRVQKPGPGSRNPLKKSIAQTRSLTLRHWQNVIGFRFAALSFSQAEKNSYAYRMSGFEEGWNFSGNENTATYTNLSPGSYRFEVKAANGDGLWNETPIFIDLQILPPPWLTWWAYLIYGLVMGAALYAFYRFRLRQKLRAVEEKARIQQARFEERENLRKQNAADFHDELGHRLTKIALFLELAERQKSEPGTLSGHLSKVRKHAAGLSAGIRDLIWTLDPTADTLLQTLVRLREFGGSLFERSGIDFQAKGLEENWEAVELKPDVRKHILLIFKEAMNNCLKYSSASRCIFLAEKIPGGLCLQLSDDGQGFDLKNAKRGYGLRNMRERAEKIGGKLSVESSPGNGTVVSLKMKMPHKG